LRWLIDVQLPPALARWLAAEGHEARHVFDEQLGEATDAAIWQRAAETAAVIVTKDEDFALRAPLGMRGPQVVWVRYGYVRKAELLLTCAGAWMDVANAIARGEPLVELA
jgi:predicted nuclease of predicted toxin-antitoxin system